MAACMFRLTKEAKHTIKALHLVAANRTILLLERALLQGLQHRLETTIVTLPLGALLLLIAEGHTPQALLPEVLRLLDLQVAEVAQEVVVHEADDNI